MTESSGIYLRLQRELMEAYVANVCETGLIERLTDELAAVRMLIGKEPVDEQSSDSTVPGLRT